MLYTVFSYIPLIEEEAGHKKTEFSKKQDNSEGPEPDPENDTETETNPETVFEKPHDLAWSGFRISKKYFVRSFLDYNFYLHQLNTPPPKISV